MATTARTGTTSAAKGTLDVAALPPNQLARRRRIVTVAGELLEDLELPDIQMRVVAEQAGVALGTLYRYFGSKDHLYVAVLLDWTDSFTNSTPNTATARSARVRRRMHRAVRAFERRPSYFRAQYLLQRSEDTMAKALFEEFAAKNVDVLVRDLEPLDRTSAEDRADIILATLSTAMTRHCMQGRPVADSYRLMDTCVDLLVGPLDEDG